MDMRMISMGLALVGGILSMGAAEKVRFDFEKYETGRTPAGFLAALTGGGGLVSWIIVEDPTSPNGPKVLAQKSSDDTDYRFPLCVYDDLAATDVTVSVRFKAVSGNTDRAAGVVVRLRDNGSYYVARANALEDNVNLYKVVDGKRSRFAGSGVKISAGDWHTLTLEVQGKHFAVSLDGKHLFDAEDGTFAGAGKVGLWTKADSVTYFDDLAIEPHDTPTP